MLKIISKGGRIARIVVLFAIVALALGVWGYLQQNIGAIPPAERSIERIVKSSLQSVPQAFGVIKPKFPSTPGTENWPLSLAKFLGPLVAYSAILLALFTVFREQIELWRISFLKNHTVIFGFSPNGKGFLKTQKDQKNSVVMDIKNRAKYRKKVHAANAWYYGVQDADALADEFNNVRVGKAKALLVSSGDDQENLELVQALSETDGCISGSGKSVMVDIGSPSLKARLEADNDFMTSLGDNEFRLFNYEQASSIGLVERLVDYLRTYQFDNSAPRILVIGGSPLAVETVIQLARVLPAHKDFKLSVDWLVEDSAEFKKELASQSPVVLTEITKAKRKSSGDLSWCFDLNFHGVAEDVAAASWSAVSQVYGTGFNAIILADGTNENLASALALRDEAVMAGFDNCLYFAFSRERGAMDKLLCRLDLGDVPVPKYLRHISQADNQNAVVEPFGRFREVCRWSAPDSERENMAKHLHESYREKRLKELGNDAGEGERNASLKPWSELSETYKNANRRAADHTYVIQWALDRVRSKSGRKPDAALAPSELEILAETEHNAWWIDRQLDGWRYGKERNNLRRLHPNLVPYGELSDDIKDYDRAQVKLLLCHLDAER